MKNEQRFEKIYANDGNAEIEYQHMSHEEAAKEYFLSGDWDASDEAGDSYFYAEEVSICTYLKDDNGESTDQRIHWFRTH